jgi:hypothetical protein
MHRFPFRSNNNLGDEDAQAKVICFIDMYFINTRWADCIP